MIVYNTTFHIEKEIKEECLTYLKATYIPQVLTSGFLHSPRLMRVMTAAEDEGESYSVQFHVKNVDTLYYWLDQEGRKMQQMLAHRFGQKLVGFATLLEEMEL